MWKTIFVLTVFAVWCVVCQQRYVCGIKQVCAQTSVQTTSKINNSTTSSVTEKTVDRPISFNWQSDEPIIGKNFIAYRDSIVRQLGDEDNLEITGFYFHQENMPSDTSYFGKMRATKVRKLFAEVMDSNRIVITEKGLREIPNVRNQRFESIDFNFIAPEQPEETANENTSVVKIDNGVRIYFEFNSARSELNEDIKVYLEDLATQMKTDGTKIRVTGHTDNVGEAKTNYNIGRQRARDIRNYLRDLGVSRQQIKVFSKGETEPIATNETDEGRAKNRRTEILIEEN